MVLHTSEHTKATFINFFALCQTFYIHAFYLSCWYPKVPFTSFSSFNLESKKKSKASLSNAVTLSGFLQKTSDATSSVKLKNGSLVKYLAIPDIIVRILK